MSRNPESKDLKFLKTQELKLLAEAESGDIGAEVVAQPGPEHHDPVAVLAEKRDIQAAVAELHDRAPEKHCLAREQLAEHGDALGLNGEPILQVQAGGESVAFLQVLVDGLAQHEATLLVFMEPLVNARLEVVFGRTRPLQLGCSNFLNQLG